LGYICRYDMKTLSPVVQLLKAFQSPNPWLRRLATVLNYRKLWDVYQTIYHHRISEQELFAQFFKRKIKKKYSCDVCHCT
jgi:hypothetical protein